MIKAKIVYGDTQLEISETISYGKYVLDQLKAQSADKNKIAMMNALTHEQTSYSQLLAKMTGIAKSLKKIQLRKGDTVAICSENCIEFIAVALGAICAGVTVTTIGEKYSKDEVSLALSITQPKVVFGSETAIETKLQNLREVSCVEQVVQINGKVNAPDVLNLDDLLQDESYVDFEPESVDAAEDIAFVIYAAGTTGVPKGIMLTHRNVVYGSEIFKYANKELSNVLSIPPWYHLYGLLTTIQYIAAGNLLVYMAKFDPVKYLAAVEKYQITKILAVPQILTLLSKSPLIAKYNLSSVKVVWCATLPVVPVDYVIGAKNNLPNCKGIFHAYGLTETCVAVLKQPEIYDENLLKEGCCGAPLPGISAKVVDINTREKLEANQEGEICLKGPTMMKGFRGNEEATKDIYDDEGFLKTGDIGYYDNNGCIYFTDILKEVITYKGHQVSPSAIESVVLQHDAVSECGVVGTRDALAGELPTAFVVRKPGVTLTEGQLIDYANARLPVWSQLYGGVIFVEEMPKSRRELRNQLRDYNK